ncbi:Crp/Fnr family transcriptional regulator [Sphingobacterium sp. SG20118]|uniref:Crp/Fnr family transcriptional regulator n=1 Tax=Sphingobacterium TaxID=28453 RepID=UPI0006898743|nr:MULTISPECIES: Crp/Fnr family transcriptional regulator [Sphingobacterium]MDH5828130.1 Crp/Fnr family transcriptional regulator [Sphingobacterium faecium]
MTVLEHFKSLYSIDDDLTFLFSQIIETKEFQKGDIIFEPDSYLKYIYFIETGLTRIFYYKNNKDITHYFFGPNTFSTGIESVFYQKPSLFGFQALTKCKISFIPFQPIFELAKTDIIVNQIIQKALLDSLISFSNRFYNTQFQTALERYQLLLEETPELLQNASLGHIASYLGISQQTLSVIRGQVV